MAINNVYSLADSGNDLFAGTLGGGVYLSTNNGTSWTQVTAGITNTDIDALVSTPALGVAGSTDLFAGIYYGGVYLSTNNGTSWTQSNAGLMDTYINALAVIPNGTDGTNFFAGTNDGVFLSTDYGASWWGSDFYYAVSSFAFPPTVGGAASGNLFAGTYGYGVFLSTNGGATWSADTAGLTNKAVYALASAPNGAGGENLFAGTYGGGVFLSTNSGTSWSPDTAGLTNKNVSSFAISPASGGAGGTKIFAGTNGGGVFVSTNNGTKWTAADSGLTNPYVLSLAVYGTNVFAGTDAGVYLSTNGTSWTADTAGLTNTVISALTVSGTNLFASTNVSGVWRRPLSQMIPTLVVSQSAVAFGSVVTHFVKTDTLKATNGSSFPLIIDSVYTSTKWFSVKSVHDTLRAGDTLKLLISFTPDSSKAYSDTLHIMSNSIASSTPLSGSGIITAVSQNVGTPKSYAISQNYPNPFNPSTMISYQLPMNSYVTLKVYDVLGREVATLINGKQSAGYYKTSFNAQRLTSGVYFYRLQAGNYSKTMKLLLLK